MNKFQLSTVSLALTAALLGGCAATATMIEKKDLVVQTKLSATVFLDPVAPEQRTLFVEVRNTSDRPDFDIERPIRSRLAQRGYILVDDPNEATFWLQANVLHVGRIDETAAEQAVLGGYGSRLGVAAAARRAGGYGRSGDNAAIAASAADFLLSRAVRDVTYSVITDVQLSQYTDQVVREDARSTLAQGTGTQRQQRVVEARNRKQYQTRVVSTANKANLQFEEALPALTSGLVQSVSGVF